MRYVLPCLIVFLVFAPYQGIAGCAEDVRVVSACYVVHGRLAVYANMRPRLQPDEGRSLIAIVPRAGLETGETDYYWPREIEEQLSMEKDIVAEFKICPFTLQKIGEMQYACIDSVSKKED